MFDLYMLDAIIQPVNFCHFCDCKISSGGFISVAWG